MTSRDQSADQFEVAIVGAGVVGAALALEFARRGASVVVVDKASDIGGGCSYANAAVLAPDHVTPLATPALLREAPRHLIRRSGAVRISPDLRLASWLGRLARSASPARSSLMTQRLQQLATDSVRLHATLAEEGLNPTFRRTGAVDVYLRQPRHEIAGGLSSTQLQTLVPGLATAAGGTHQDDEWVVESRSFMQSVLDGARDLGAQVRFGTKVSSLLAEHGRVVGLKTDQGVVRAGHVVVAGGVESGRLTAPLGLALPLRGGRGYGVDVAGPLEAVPIPVRLKEHRVVVTPLVDRIRVCGTLEFGPERRPMDLRRADALLALAIEALPDLAGQQVIDRWAGDRPCTHDGIPAIGATRQIARLSVAVGHGMWGLILAPITAQMIADEVDGTPLADMQWLDPDRFSRHGRREARHIAHSH